MGGIYQLYRLLGQEKFRRRRAQMFIEHYRPEPATRILDVGGFSYDWRHVPIESHVTCVNIEPEPAHQTGGRFTSEFGDGCALRFTSGSFDIAYSNSVIEHLGTFDAQEKFAKEIRRVGKKVFVQTPNRWFPIEPHFIAVPGVHYLPWKLARRLLPFVSLRGLVRRGDNVDLRKLATELRYLSFREMQQLFPDCHIYREKVFGITKSFIAMRR